jgi:hypothetical protein
MLQSNRIGFNLSSPGVMHEADIDSIGENLKVDLKPGNRGPGELA